MPGSGVAWADGQMSGPIYAVTSPGYISARLSDEETSLLTTLLARMIDADRY